MPGRLVCFVCGNVGAETSIHVKPQESGPYFPFLEHHDPPKGSRPPAFDGSVDCCRVCFAFLTTQWELYERNKTPAIKRLYWLKRADNGNFTGAEMRLQGEYIAQVMGLQYQPGSFEFDNAVSPDNSTVDSNFHPRASNSASKPQPQSFSQVANDHRHRSDSKPYVDSALDLSTPKKEPDHIKSNGDATRMPDSHDFICLVCRQEHAASYGSYINVFQQNPTEPYFPVLESIKPYPGSEHITRSGQVKVCGHCKNVLYQQWQAYEVAGTPVSLRTYKIPSSLFKTIQSDTQQANKRVESRDNTSISFVCYICGISNSLENASVLHTLPPKSPSSVVMFFPFIRELQRPRGAEPLRPDGSVIACIKCYGSLSYQWQVQEVDGVPLYHRNYSLHFLSVKQPMQEVKSSPQNSDESVKPLNIHISTASPVPKSQDTVTSGFPTTQGLLAIAPVLSSEDSLSNSPSKFHDSLTDSKTTLGDTTYSSGSVKTVPHPLQQVMDIPKKICFVCGERCLISRMHYLNAYPARHEAKHTNSQIDPFFPFLTSCEPAPKADPVTEDGIVIACKICYHTLMKQWSEFEQSKNPGDSNRWLRKYSIPNYACYVCAAFCERKYLRSLETDKFHFLKEHNAPPDSLVMDEGETVAVCKPCAYSLMQQYAEFKRMGLPAELRKYNWMQKAPVMLADNAQDEESQDEHRFDESYQRMSHFQPSNSATEKDRSSQDPKQGSDQGGPTGSKPPLSMMSPAGNKLQRNTATVSPLDHVTSPTNGVTSIGANAALNASRTSSFAAALRKLANQAKDSPDEAKTSTSSSPRETTTKAGPPPLVYTSTPMTTPPVVTIAPTQTHPSLLSSDVRPPLERLHSSHSSSSLFDSAHAKADRDRPQSSASRDEGRASRDGHSQSARRVTPHSTPGTTPPLSGREETSRGFQPYRPGEDLRAGLPSSLALEQAAAAAAAYSYPPFLPPHAFPHPAFRFDDPLLLERYRMMQHPYLPYGPPGMMPHPGLHPLIAAGGRYPPELLHPHLAFNAQANRLPEHRSPSLHPDRQRLEDEKREFEREREKERERERERDLAIYRDRQRALERENEKQRDRDRSSHREREEREKRDSADKPKAEAPTGKTDESLTAKFGSIIQGTPKGLGIADRYPRAPSSSHSANLTLGKREDRRDSKDENSSFLSHSFNRLTSHKSSSRDDQKPSDADKRYSLVTPMSSSERNGPPPLISPKSSDPKPNKSEGSLFRPFDSKFLTNGYESQHSDKEKLIPPRGDLDMKKLEPDSSLNLGHSSIDHKSSFLPSGEKSLYSKFGSSSSAFHSLDSKAVKSKHSADSKNVQSTHSICSPLHHLGQKESLPLTTLPNSNQTPLNIPAYSAKNFLSSSNLFPESQSCVSKLDLEERKMSESRSNGSYCSDSDCDMNLEDSEDVKNLLISSGPPLQLDTCRKKMTLMKELGLTTHRHKKDKQFELFRERRRKMHERSVSPMNIDEAEQRLSPLKCTYSPASLCREPDYKMKCQFLSQMLRLEPVPAATRESNEKIFRAVEEDRRKRLKLRRLHLELTPAEDANSTQSGDSGEENSVNISQSSSSFITSPRHLNCITSQSDINRNPNYSTGSLSQLSELTTSVMRHTRDVKSEAGVILNSKEKLSKNFAEEFHRSVLQTMRQREISQRSGDISSQGHSSRHEGQSSRPFHLQHILNQWPGVEAVMETYERHNIDDSQERQLLLNRTKSLQHENKELSRSAEILSKRMEDLLKNKIQLEEERLYRQTCIDGLKSAIKKLKK